MSDWKPITDAPRDGRVLRVRDARGAEGSCVYESGAWRTSKNKFRVDAVAFLKTWTNDAETQE